MNKFFENLQSKWNVLAMVLVAMMSLSFASCGGDDDDDGGGGGDLTIPVWSAPIHRKTPPLSAFHLHSHDGDGDDDAYAWNYQRYSPAHHP